MGMGFEARAAHPCSTQIWVPPPGIMHALNQLYGHVSIPKSEADPCLTLSLTILSTMNVMKWQKYIPERNIPNIQPW